MLALPALLARAARPRRVGVRARLAPGFLAALGLACALVPGQGKAQGRVDGGARIVTLTPSLTEAVCALDRCGQLVATDRHSDWPARVQQLPKVGGLADAHIERIVALRPSLVLMGPCSRA